MLGTALGIMTSVQMIGIGLCNFAIGGILDHWKYALSHFVNLTYNSNVFVHFEQFQRKDDTKWHTRMSIV